MFLNKKTLQRNFVRTNRKKLKQTNKYKNKQIQKQSEATT